MGTMLWLKLTDDEIIECNHKYDSHKPDSQKYELDTAWILLPNLQRFKAILEGRYIVRNKIIADFFSICRLLLPLNLMLFERHLEH